MLSAAVDLTFDDDGWINPAPGIHYRAASVGNSWGVTSIGRGFQWAQQTEDVEQTVHPKESLLQLPQVAVKESEELLWSAGSYNHGISPSIVASGATLTPTLPAMVTPSALSVRPPSTVDSQSCSPSTKSPSVASSGPSATVTVRVPLSRSPSSPRPRRRSSQQRVSLIAGRVSIAPMEPPSPPPLLAPSLQRAGSTSSFLSNAVSTGPPTPSPEPESFLGGRSISDFAIDSEIGRGAYGLVKRGREIRPDGSLGVRSHNLHFSIGLSIECWME